MTIALIITSFLAIFFLWVALANRSVARQYHFERGELAKEVDRLNAFVASEAIAYQDMLDRDAIEIRKLQDEYSAMERLLKEATAPVAPPTALPHKVIWTEAGEQKEQQFNSFHEAIGHRGVVRNTIDPKAIYQAN